MKVFHLFVFLVVQFADALEFSFKLIYKIGVAHLVSFQSDELSVCQDHLAAEWLGVFINKVIVPHCHHPVVNALSCFAGLPDFLSLQFTFR